MDTATPLITLVLGEAASNYPQIPVPVQEPQPQTSGRRASRRALLMDVAAAGTPAPALSLSVENQIHKAVAQMSAETMVLTVLLQKPWSGFRLPVCMLFGTALTDTSPKLRAEARATRAVTLSALQDGGKRPVSPRKCVLCGFKAAAHLWLPDTTRPQTQR
ncbi:hypothetical protein SKAU_G00054110 [Synaphobranchus kaupii]|uniref:Uncharacterized protein n=1 Tax=Synaphobranchus kaupii TaxID=118154 RepID=A0A9Q1G421_SYNKA|nr:hypothetical protein SKAU_G00054110 [Synaphobranchus kaupii]